MKFEEMCEESYYLGPDDGTYYRDGDALFVDTVGGFIRAAKDLYARDFDFLEEWGEEGYPIELDDNQMIQNVMRDSDPYSKDWEKEEPESFKIKLEKHFAEGGAVPSHFCTTEW